MSCFSIEEGKILSGWLPHREPHDLSEALACCPAEMPAEHRSYIQLSSWQEAPTGSNAVFQCAKKKPKNRCCPTSQLGQKELMQSSMGQQNTVSVTSFINDFTRCFAVRSQKQEGFKWVTKAGSESAPSGGITNSNPLHRFRARWTSLGPGTRGAGVDSCPSPCMSRLTTSHPQALPLARGTTLLCAALRLRKMLWSRPAGTTVSVLLEHFETRAQASHTFRWVLCSWK